MSQNVATILDRWPLEWKMLETDKKPGLSCNDYYIISDDDDDDDDEYDDDNLPSNELYLKVKLFRNLCLGNKINTDNAFDIDMIGYFRSWLEKQKISTNNDVTTFQEIADYLEATTKIYGYRVDNLSETTSKLVEGIKLLNTNKLKMQTEVLNTDDEEEEFLKNLKSKNLRLMLTTADKLNVRSDMEFYIDPAMRQLFSDFSFKEVFHTGRPANHMLSLYNDITIQNELNINTINKEDDESSTIQIPNIVIESWPEEVLCSEFCGFLSERDRVNHSSESGKSEDLELEDIEDHFDPGNLSFTNSICKEVDNQESYKFDQDACSNNKEDTAVEGLLACLDTVKRDYSFFNPKLLAKWNGPRAWKAQAMAKALKSTKSKVPETVVYDPDIDNYSDTDDDNISSKSKSKNNKIRFKDGDEHFKIEWSSSESLKSKLEDSFHSKEKILPRTLQKWTAVNNMSENKVITTDVAYRFTFLEYFKVTPDWWAVIKKEISEKRKQNKINASLRAASHVDTDYSDQAKAQIFEAINDDIKDEIHDNIKEDIRDDINDNIKKEIKDDINDNIKKEIKDDINDNIKKEIKDDINDNIKYQINNYIKDDINDNMNDNVNDDNSEDINDDIYDDGNDDVNENINDDISDDISDAGQQENNQSPNSDSDESSEDDTQDCSTETSVDIAEVKREMSEIIDEECIITDSDSEWSSYLLFSDLYQKLNSRPGLSIGIAYVSLLHLVNERGLKLFQDGSIINGRREFYIARPIINQ